MLNKTLIFLYAIVSILIKRDDQIWVYGEGDLNSVLPLLKYAKTKDKRLHVYITSYASQIEQLKNDDILAVKKTSLLAYYYISRARVHVICKSSLEDLNKYLSYNAVIINLFHGIPTKTIGIEGYLKSSTYPLNFKTKRKIKKLKKRYSRYVFLCATSSLTQDLFSRCFGVDKKNLPIVGEPRNDILLEKNNRVYIEDLIGRELAGIKKIFSYMPTWRDYSDWSPDIDFSNMNNFLKLNNSILIIRPHPSDSTFKNVGEYSNIHFSTASEWSDSYSELCGADCLISDYSSLIHEFIITRKPILIYTPDYAQYTKNRKLMLDFDSHIPGRRINTYQDLIKSMQDVVNESYSYKDYSNILSLYHDYTDNLSSDRVYKYINKLM
jgi:CDP-glycerol glycerophosphotransferase (TagB/SpsB family)